MKYTRLFYYVSHSFSTLSTFWSNKVWSAGSHFNVWSLYFRMVNGEALRKIESINRENVFLLIFYNFLSHGKIPKKPFQNFYAQVRFDTAERPNLTIFENLTFFTQKKKTNLIFLQKNKLFITASFSLERKIEQNQSHSDNFCKWRWQCCLQPKT